MPSLMNVTRRAKEIIENNEAVTPDKLIGQLDCKRHTASQAIYALKNAGLAERIVDGVYARPSVAQRMRREFGL